MAQSTSVGTVLATGFFNEIVNVITLANLENVLHVPPKRHGGGGGSVNFYNNY